MRTHGIKATYNAGCRCDECREGQRVARKAWRDRSRAANTAAYQHELECSRRIKHRYRGTCEDCGGPTTWSDSKRPVKRCARCDLAHRKATAAPCGTNAAYGNGCRCDDCRAAHATYMREWYARLKATA